jgi:hypothetical protein
MTHVSKSQYGKTLEIRADRIEPAVDLANRQFDETHPRKGPAPPRLWNGARQTIRRNELRLLVPLADTPSPDVHMRRARPASKSKTVER